MKRLLLGVVLLLLAASVACQSPDPTATPTPAHTPTPVPEPMATPTPVPEPSPTSTPTPTPTLLSARIDSVDIQDGDCIDSTIEEGVTIESVVIVPCSGSWQYRVLSSFVVADSPQYPGEDHFGLLASEQCDRRFTFFLYPASESWALRDRTISCLQESFGLSANDPAKLDRLVAESRLNVGECYNEAPETGGLLFEVVDCSGGWKYRVLNSFVVADSPIYPGEDHFSLLANERCDRRFTDFLHPTSESWALRDRTVSCLQASSGLSVTVTPRPTPTPAVAADPAPTPTQADIIARVTPSVVSISTEFGWGSGVVIREDGLILTAFHVVEDAASITVGFNDGSESQAKLLGEDLGQDLAVIKVPRSGLSPVPLADGDSLRIGEAISTLGYSEGYLALSTGVVSALVEPYRIDGRLIQITADVNAGDSGGAVLTPTGELAGIMVSALIDSAGVGFASPLDEQLIGRMANGERICQPTPPLLSGRAFSHPNGWHVDLPPGVEYDDSFSPDEPGYHAVARETPYPWMQVQIEELPLSYSSIYEFLEDESGWEDWSYTAITDGRPVCHPGGSEAWEFDYKAIDEAGSSYYERDLVIRNGQSWYLLLAIAPYDGFQDVEQELDTVLYSFGFTR